MQQATKVRGRYWEDRGSREDEEYAHIYKSHSEALSARSNEQYERRRMSELPG